MLSQTSVAKSLRARAERLIAAGLCRDCGKREHARIRGRDRTLCEECLLKRRVRQHNKVDMTGEKPIHNVKRVRQVIPPISERCAICGDVLTSRSANLDHDHLTGKIRGWLCHACNLGLGQFRDSIRSLEAAIEYLKRD